MKYESGSFAEALEDGRVFDQVPVLRLGKEISGDGCDEGVEEHEGRVCKAAIEYELVGEIRGFPR
jgi:hypothetical protein